ncbi:MAG TPA: hypothetical protein DCX06_12995 [Opitutae bacterium]|nr:hypothetical protein [Opitutae bacterium]
MSRKETRISVIVVTLNAVDVIEQTLISIFDQKDPNLEIILKDGGSEDGTLGLVEYYSDRLDRVIVKPDQGIYDAMNQAAVEASGEWVIFMNAGDCFHHSTVLCEIRSLLQPQADLILGATEFLVRSSEGLRVFATRPRALSRAWFEMPTCHQSLFVRRKLLIEEPFDTSFRIAADQAQMLSLFQRRVNAIQTDICISQFDTSGGENYKPFTWLNERWKVSRSGASRWRRLRAFAPLYCSELIWRTLQPLLQRLPASISRKIRSWRGTLGKPQTAL